jgi:hypothetical protein
MAEIFKHRVERGELKKHIVCSGMRYLPALSGLSGISPGLLQQLFQLFECFGVLRADRRIVAAGIRSLQSTRFLNDVQNDGQLQI